MFKTLVNIAAALALGIVILGAYVRLNDAGLGGGYCKGRKSFPW